MGGSDSQFEHGHMVVKLDKNFYMAGDEVTGTVYMDLS